MKIKRHKKFLKDFKDTKLLDSQFEKFVYYINALRTDTPLPPESKNHISVDSVLKKPYKIIQIV